MADIRKRGPAAAHLFAVLGSTAAGRTEDLAGMRQSFTVAEAGTPTAEDMVAAENTIAEDDHCPIC